MTGWSIPDRVAQVLADREPVAWNEVLRLAHDQRERAVLEQLAFVDAVSAASRAPDPHVALGESHHRWHPSRLLAMSAVLSVCVALAHVAIHPPLGQRFWPVQVALLITLSGAAAALAFGGRGEPRAYWLMLLYLAMAAAFSTPLAPQTGVLAWLHVATYGVYLDAFGPYVLWRFVAIFPQTERFTWMDRASRLAATAACAVGATLVAVNVCLAWFANLQSSPANRLGRAHPGELYWDVLYVLLLPAALAVPARAWLAGREERKRVALFGAAIGCGLAPLVAKGLLQQLFPGTRALLLEVPFGRHAVDAVVLGSMLAMPPLTLYAILVRQALPVRMILRRAAQYALARRAVGIMAVLVWSTMGWWLTRHRHESLGTLFEHPTTGALSVLCVAALVALVLREHIGQVVDRVFSRRRPEYSRELANCTRVLQTARSASEVAAILAEYFHDVLQAKWSALLDVQGDMATSVYGAAPPLPTDSCLLLLARESTAVALPRLVSLLPPAERRWVEVSRAEVLVLVSKPGGHRDAVLVVGAKQTDLPWEHDDLLSLATLAHAASLALAHVRKDAAAAEPPDDDYAAECLHCGTVAETRVARCYCGGEWQPAALPARLGTKFRVDCRIGRGGMGLVYRGVDLTLYRDVALKTLPRASEEALARFRDEAKAMARVMHPHLATLFGVETWRQTPVLVMEYLPHGTLLERLRKGALGMMPARELAIEVAGALQALHMAGLVHGDIKPSNIGFAATSAAKLLDFGLAQFFAHAPAFTSGPEDSADVRAATTWGGTPAYMSPEAVRGGPPSLLSDLWALAVVLHEAIVGRHPFPGRTVEDVFRQIRKGPPPLPRDNPALAALFELLLHPRAERRPQSAQEFITLLETHMSDVSTTQHRSRARFGGTHD